MSSSVWCSDDLSEEIIKNDEFIKNAKYISEDVVNKKIEITTLIERLAGVLTNANPDVRSRGTQLFSNVLSLLPEDFLTQTQLNFITTFYNDRLKDNHRVIPPVLEGILALIKMKNLPNDAPVKLLTSIYHNVPCQQQLRTDRQNIYSIIHILTVNNTKELKAMGPDFVFGVIAAIDGERDPRNLLLLFSIIPTLLKLIPLGHLCEEMFEVMACYYPVDFNSMRDDPNAINRNDLAEKLCFCLCGTPSFAEFCLSLLLEKLDSSLRLAKLDSLKLLKESCQVFESTSYEVHLPTIWSHLQKELSHKSDVELVRCAHNALQALLANLANAPNPSQLLSFLKNILISMQCLLVEAKTKLSLEFPLKVFETTAVSSENCCIFVTENVVPLVLNNYLLNCDEKLQVVSLLWFTRIFESCRNWNTLNKALSFFNGLSDISISAIGTASHELKLAGFSSLTSMPEVVQPNDVSKLYEIFHYNINYEKSLVIVHACKQCLLALASENPSSYSDFVTRLSSENEVNDSFILERRLDFLCSLASIDLFTESIFYRILHLFSESDVPTASLLISVLLENFKNVNIFNSVSVQQLQLRYQLLKHILSWVDRHKTELDMHFFICTSKLIVVIVQSLNHDVQSEQISLYIPDYIKQLSKGDNQAIVWIEALVNSSRSSVCLENFNEVLQRAMDVVFESSDEFIVERACVLIATILNKHGKNEQLFQSYNIIKKKLCDELDDKNISLKTIHSSITLCSWITKALLLSGHPEGAYWLAKLTCLLSDNYRGLLAAKGFKLIMHDDPETLNVSSFSIVNFLYKQKVFNLFWAATDDAQQNGEHSTARESFLLAWIYIIRSVPKSVVQMESSKLSSILIESLNYSEVDLLLGSTSILSFLAQLKDPSISDSLQTLLPRCLKLTSFKHNMSVRMNTLQCLFDIANFYPTVIVLPYKQEVVIQLAGSLDDPKRLVRNIAVKARTRWFLIGSPGEEKVKNV